MAFGTSDTRRRLTERARFDNCWEGQEYGEELLTCKQKVILQF